jgi:DNA-binding protein HU-beta
MAETLGKGQIAARVASKLNSTQAEGGRALNAVLDVITDALKEGDTVTLTGFGTFEVRQVGERTVRAIRGPQAGQMVKVPSHKRPGFRAGSELVRAVEGS